MTPESRRDELLTQPVGDELVIYDERTCEAHRLNPTAALVWRLADGERSVSQLASDLRTSLSDGGAAAAVEESDSEELVRLALIELDRAGLLARALPTLAEPMTRRKMLAVTAALLPVVASIVAPTPAMAITLPSSSSSTIISSSSSSSSSFFPSSSSSASTSSSSSASTSSSSSSSAGGFLAYNGTYSCSGKPGTPNTCGLVAGSVTMVLSLTAAGTGTLTKTHQNGTVFACTVGATQTTATTISVTGTGTSKPPGYSSTESYVFSLGPPTIVSGNQGLAGPDSCVSNYLISGSRVVGVR